MATTDQSDILKSFLVEIGFKVDEAGFKKFRNGLSQSTKDTMLLGGAVIGTGMAIEKFVEAIADQMSKLYLTSEATNSSISNLMRYGAAFSAIGESGAQAQGHVEKFASVLGQFGEMQRFELIARSVDVETIDKKTGHIRDFKELLDDFVDAMLKHVQKPGEVPTAESVQARQFLKDVGFGDNTELMKYKMERDHMKEMEATFTRLNDNAGNTTKVLQKQGEQSLAFERDLTALGMAFGAIATALARISMPALDAVVRFLTFLATVMGKDRRTDVYKKFSEGDENGETLKLPGKSPLDKLTDWFSGLSPSAPAPVTPTAPSPTVPEPTAPVPAQPHVRPPTPRNKAEWDAAANIGSAAGAAGPGRAGTIQYPNNFAYDPDYLAGQGRYNYANLASIGGSITNARLGTATPPGAAGGGGKVDNSHNTVQGGDTTININGPATPDAVASVKSIVRRSNEDMQRMGLGIFATPTY